MKERILVVDDEASIRTVLHHILRRRYQVDTAESGEAAIEKLKNGAYDLILLDLKLGETSGLDVLAAARKQDPDIIVIILTAYGTLDSAVEALRLGAFDYIFKPAAPELLRQRVKAGLERRARTLQQRALMKQIAALRETLQTIELHETASQPRAEDRFLRSGKLIIDQHHRTAVLGETHLPLTTAELDILICLVQASPEPLSPKELVKCALGYETSPVEASELIKWHIHRIRKKMEPDPKKPVYLKTVRNRGYLWCGE